MASNCPEYADYVIIEENKSFTRAVLCDNMQISLFLRGKNGQKNKIKR